jgi:anti-sigma factor RsiW
MHQPIRKNLEEYLKSSVSEIPAEFQRHVGACEECAGELRLLEAQSQLLRSLAGTNNGTKDVEPRAGFYARVMERIEAQQPFSIWSAFLDRKFGFRLAVASGILVALLGAYLVTSEPSGPETGVAATVAMSGAASGTPSDAGEQQQRDAVLVDLASYHQ